MIGSNWGPVMFFGVALVAGVYYLAQGRFHYTAPLSSVNNDAILVEDESDTTASSSSEKGVPVSSKKI